MHRRTFLTRSGQAGLVLAAPHIAWNVGRKARNIPLGLGIIGTGDRGGGLIPVLQEIEGIRIRALCDTLPFRLEAAHAAAGTSGRTYADYRELLDDPDVEAVLIATPFSTHAEIATAALEAGKHVYCEKTLAKGYEAIAKLVRTAEASGLVFQTGHQYHSSRLYSQVAAMLNEGKAGRIAAVECQWNRNGDWRRPVPDPSLERQINWRMYREYSGGLLAELCSHQLDFVNWFTGEVPVDVRGTGGIDYWQDGRETFDNIHLIYRYPGGIKATFTCLTSNAKDDYKIRILGDKGTMILDYAQAWFYPEDTAERATGNVDGVSGATQGWVEGKGYPLDISHLDPSKQALLDFRDAVLDRSQPLSGVRSGAKAAVCVQMGLDAMYENRVVSWPEGLKV